MTSLVNYIKYRVKNSKFLQALSVDREGGNILYNPFYEASINLISKPEKDITKKNYKPISLINIVTKKFLDKNSFKMDPKPKNKMQSYKIPRI